MRQDTLFPTTDEPRRRKRRSRGTSSGSSRPGGREAPEDTPTSGATLTAGQRRAGTLAALLFGAGMLWGLLLFGAVQAQTYSWLFLYLLVPSALALWALPLKPLLERRFLALPAVGALLLAQIAFKDTLEAQGYVILGLVWLVFSFTLLWTRSDPSAARRVTGFLILLGCLQAFYGLVQALGGVDYIGGYFRDLGRIATGTLVNPNHFAGLLNMIFCLALGALVVALSTRIGGRSRHRTSEGLARLWIILLPCAVIGLAVLLSQSRGGTVSLLAGLLFLGLMVLWKRRQGGGSPTAAVAILVLLLVTLGMGGWVALETVWTRFEQVETDHVRRADLYRDSLRLIGDHAVAGVGPRMFEWRFRPYQTSQVGVIYEHAHNDYLQTAAEWGVPAAVLFWSFVLWRLWTSIGAFFRSRNPERQGLALGCAAAILSLLFHSLVDFNLQIPANFMVFAAILALSWTVTLDGAYRVPRSAHGGTLKESPLP